MTTEWAVTTGTDRIALDAKRNADVIFTVTNPAQVGDRAVLDVVPSDTADTSWFTVEEPQRLISAGASVPYRVNLVIPLDAPAGRHYVQARVYSADSAPEENSRLSNRIRFDVPDATPAPRKPWWLIVVAALVAVVIGVVVWVVLRPGPDPETPAQAAVIPSTTTPGPSATTADPNVSMINLIGMSEEEATRALQQVDLTVGTVRYHHQPAQTGKVIDQSVKWDTEIKRGSAVTIDVAVTLTAPGLNSPGNGTTFAKGAPSPTLNWESVPHAAKYRVLIEYEVCVSGWGTKCEYHSVTMKTPPGSIPYATVMIVESPSVSPTIGLTPQGPTSTRWHSGKVRWQVWPLDIVDGRGPSSGYFTFEMTLK